MNTLPFGRQVAAFRVGRGLSQAQLAEKAQMSTNHLQAIEVGKVVLPRPATVNRIVKALGAVVVVTLVEDNHE